MLMRHGERTQITDAAKADQAMLTDSGIREAKRMGAEVGAEYPQVQLFHSPVPRCGQTAKAIEEGNDSPHLGMINHGPNEALFPPFTPEHVQRFQNDHLSHYDDTGFVRAWLGQTLDGRHYPDPQQAAEAQLLFLRERRRRYPGLHLHISHDCNILLMMQSFMEIAPQEHLWPNFLEPLLLTMTGDDGITFHYRDHETTLTVKNDAPSTLCEIRSA
ncbi:MAG: histidine phosphatase family protein [Magnetococcales bacterium]|nr:histidine phosphatase family protein [Magnetococcales bacterium]